jgi:hypothetical protein
MLPPKAITAENRSQRTVKVRGAISIARSMPHAYQNPLSTEKPEPNTTVHAVLGGRRKDGRAS